MLYAYICSMYYRRKIILALLELFDGELEKIRLQKLLFLFCQKQIKADYDFIPYKYGCYSFSAKADLTTMVTKGYLMETEQSFIKSHQENYMKLLKDDDLTKLKNIKTLYGKMSGNSLMLHTYRNFPYTAINSIKANSILTDKELLVVKKQVPLENDKTVLFTIGYEGGSLENYLNRLIKNDVKVLVDVRNNPLSMKFGFSKGQLKSYCENLNIEYVHFPEVGIISSKRKELNTQEDFDNLFEDYRRNNLPKTLDIQKQILKILKENKRIALTCFEANHCQCHRSHLANSISTLPGFSYDLKHI